MKKYMGNKSRILPDIFCAAQSLAPDKCTIFDAFSGTTNVGQYFRKHGYKTISNDVNTTSRLLGQVYLTMNAIPDFSVLFSSGCFTARHLARLSGTDEFSAKKEHFISLNHNTNHEEYLRSVYDTNAFCLLVYLSFYADHRDYEDPFYTYQLLAPDFIWRNFCVKGYHSTYFNLVSQKSILSQIESLEAYARKHGSHQTITRITETLRLVYQPPFHMELLKEAISLLEEYVDENRQLPDAVSLTRVLEKLKALDRRTNHTGNRRFFSEDHGHRIDTINNLALLWLRDGLISPEEYRFIQCALVEATALFSNTSATYQAFYKTYRANTLQEFRLVFPEITPSDREHVVYCEDTFELIKTMKDDYDILYLDPPYNWRIYDSNYHLLNLLSDYANIANTILDYEAGIAGAAGENRTLVREYTNYNRRDTFETLLFQLILSSRCRYVILSYSDSLSNHNKNSLSSTLRIDEFFRNPRFFVPGSYRKIEVGSVNFESRKSEKKAAIHELLFVAERINTPENALSPDL